MKRFIHLTWFLLLLIGVSCQQGVVDTDSTHSDLQLTFTRASDPSAFNDVDVFVFKEPNGVLDTYKHEGHVAGNSIHIACTSGERTVIVLTDSKIDFVKHPIKTKQELQKKMIGLIDATGTSIQAASLSMYGNSGVITIAPQGTSRQIKLKRHAAVVYIDWDAAALGNTTDKDGWTTIGANKGSKGDMYKIERVLLINVPNKCSVQPDVDLPANTISYLCGTGITPHALVKTHQQAAETDVLAQTVSSDQYVQKQGIYTYANHPDVMGTAPTTAVLVARYKRRSELSLNSQGTRCYYPIPINYGNYNTAYKMDVNGKHIQDKEIGGGISANTKYHVTALITGIGTSNPWDQRVKVDATVALSGLMTRPLQRTLTAGVGGKKLSYQADTTTPNELYTLSFPSGFDGMVDWGDGAAMELSSTGEVTHTYTAVGKYDVNVYGLWDNPKVELKLSGAKISLLFLGAGVTSFKLKGGRAIAQLSVSSDFFQANTGTLDGIEEAFKGCTGLTAIPSGLFAHFPWLQDWRSLFEGCTGLTTIPQDLLSGANNAAVLDHLFAGCTGLTTIPQDLLNNCIYIHTLNHMFESCTGLTTIPQDLLKKNRFAEQIDYMFNDCPSLHGFLDLHGLNLHAKLDWNGDSYLQEVP